MSDFNLDTEFRASVTLHQAGRLEQASQGYRRVLAAVPHQPVVMGYLGMAMAQAERFAAAVRLLGRSLALSREDAVVWNNFGNALAALRRRDEAVIAYRRAIGLAPAFAAPHLNQAVLDPAAGRRTNRLLRSAQCDPAYTPAHVALVAAEDSRGRPVAARRSGHRATAISPQEPTAHLALADHRLAANQAHLSRVHAARALAIGGDLAPALYRLGLADERLAALDDAGRQYRRALALAPDLVPGHTVLGSLELGLGFPAIAVAAYRRAAAIAGRSDEVEGNRLFALAFLASSDPQALVSANRRWAGERFPHRSAETGPARPSRRSDRLRIGYVSPEFVKHGFLAHLFPALDHHDRSRFEIFAYGQMPRHDRWTDEVRKRVDTWRDIAGLPVDEQAAAIRTDGIDVLVNLTGYLAHQRTLFASRIAAAQIAYLNHISTTGFETIDGRITDAWLEPEGAPFLDRDERLLRLESGYASYAPPDAPPVDELPALRHAFVTFGVFNNVAKASDEALDVWARILGRVPRSRIVIKGSGLSAGRARSRILAAFARRGVEAHRLDLIGRIDSDLDNLSAVARADIALDPFPFNGGMSTVETLWMGVPVISLAGPSLVHRIGLTFLTRAGFPEWAVSSVDDYVDLAVALAADTVGLAVLRRGMRERLRGSALLDATRHTRELEGVYVALWRERTGRSGP